MWKAPELLRDETGQIRASQKADIYAFGIILFEIMTRQEAFAVYASALEPQGELSFGGCYHFYTHSTNSSTYFFYLFGNRLFVWPK